VPKRLPWCAICREPATLTPGPACLACAWAHAADQPDACRPHSGACAHGGMAARSGPGMNLRSFRRSCGTWRRRSTRAARSGAQQLQPHWPLPMRPWMAARVRGQRARAAQARGKAGLGLEQPQSLRPAQVEPAWTATALQRQCPAGLPAASAPRLSRHRPKMPTPCSPWGRQRDRAWPAPAAHAPARAWWVGSQLHQSWPRVWVRSLPVAPRMRWRRAGVRSSRPT